MRHVNPKAELVLAERFLRTLKEQRKEQYEQPPRPPKAQKAKEAKEAKEWVSGPLFALVQPISKTRH